MSRLQRSLIHAAVGVILAGACNRASDSPNTLAPVTQASVAEPAGLHAKNAGCYFVRATKGVSPAERAATEAMTPIVADSLEEHDARGTVHSLAWHRADIADQRIGSWTAYANGEMVWSMTTGLGGAIYRGKRADSTFVAEVKSAGDIAPSSEDLGQITFVRRPCPPAIDVSSGPALESARRPSNDR